MIYIIYDIKCGSVRRGVEPLTYTSSFTIIYHFPQSFLIFPSLLPHFHHKTTQIITLGVIKHDQASFANG
jgi:hypothetical protein